MTSVKGEARHRPIGFPALLALGVNGIIGVGIFFAPAEVAREVPGVSGALVYLATLVALLPIAFGYAALGRRFSVDGGPYVWAEAAFGPGVAFLVGWITYVSSVLSLAAVMTALAHHAAPAFGVSGVFGERALAVSGLALLALVASSGLSPSAMVWSAVTLLKLLPLVILVLLGALSTATPVDSVRADHAVTFGSLERAVLVVVFACQGFEIVPLLAGSVRRPSSAVPTATVLSLVFAAGLYAALHALAARAVPDLGRSAAPLVDAAHAYGGGAARAAVAAGANVSALGIAFGMLNTTPRYLSALSGERSLGPWIGAVDGRMVPSRALWVTTLVAAGFVLYADRLTTLFVLSSLAVLAQFAAALASLAVLAHRRVHGFSRRDLWPVPLSLVGIVLAGMGARLEEVLVAVGVVGVGVALRWLVRGRARATPAPPSPDR